MGEYQLIEEFPNSMSGPVCLRVSIAEPILLCCINEASFSEIYLNTQNIIPISKMTLKTYIFHLVNNGFVSYNGMRSAYVTEDCGKDLLEVIYTQRKKTRTNFKDLMIEID
jgi:hypothetical protein